MHKLNGIPVGSNLFVPKKSIKHKVRINSNLQKHFVIMPRYLESKGSHTAKQVSN